MAMLEKQEYTKPYEENRPKKVPLERPKEEEKRENIYIQNNNESALSSFYGNVRPDDKKNGGIVSSNSKNIPSNKISKDHIEKKFYESDKLKNFKYEKEDSIPNQRKHNLRPNESSNTDDKNTYSNQDKLLSSNENFFREDYKGDISPLKNYIKSIQTGGSLELSESKQQSDSDNNFTHVNYKYLPHDSKQNTQKLTFKNQPVEENIHPDDKQCDKIHSNNSIKRNLNLGNHYEIETNTNTHKDNTSYSKDTDPKDKNSFRTGVNYQNAVSPNSDSSSNTIKPETSKFISPSHRENNERSYQNKIKELESKSGTIGFSSSRKGAEIMSNRSNEAKFNENTIKTLENSQRFNKPSNYNQNTMSISDEALVESHNDNLKSYVPQDKIEKTSQKMREYPNNSHVFNSSLKENTLSSNEALNREISQLRKQNKELYNQLNHTKIEKKSLNNHLKKIENQGKIKEKAMKDSHYTPQKEFLGVFLEKVVDKSLYLYKNNNCHTCSKLLSQGKSRRDCPKNH